MHPPRLRYPVLRSSPKAAAAGFEEAAAQELFRVVLFLVYYGETWVMGHLPYIGRYIQKEGNLCSLLDSKDEKLSSPFAA